MKKHALLLPIVLSAITAAPIITPFVTVAASEQTSVKNPQQVTKVHVTYKTPDGTVIDEGDHDVIGQQQPFYLNFGMFIPSGYGATNQTDNRVLISDSNQGATFIVDKILNIPVVYVDESGKVLAQDIQNVVKGGNLVIFDSPISGFGLSREHFAVNQMTVVKMNVQDETHFTVVLAPLHHVKITYVDNDSDAVVGTTTADWVFGQQIFPGSYISQDTTGYFYDPSVTAPFTINEENPTIKVLNNKRWVRTTYLDDSGNSVYNTAIALKRNSNGAIDVSSKIPAGYHLPSGSSNLVTPPADRSSWNVTVTNKKDSGSSTPSQPSNPIYIQPNTPAPESKYEKFDGTATIMSDNANLYSNTDLSVSLNRHLAKGTSWHIFGVQRAGGDTAAYNLGGSQWISARDVLIADNAAQPSTKPTQPNQEVALSGTFTVKVPNHSTWSTVLWDKDGKPSSHFLKPNTSWKVYAKKFTGGKTYYRLGSQNQWVESIYGTLK